MERRSAIAIAAAVTMSAVSAVFALGAASGVTNAPSATPPQAIAQSASTTAAVSTTAHARNSEDGARRTAAPSDSTTKTSGETDD
jgi:hypothetical protein